VDRGHRGGAGMGSESIPDRACKHYDPEDDGFDFSFILLTCLSYPLQAAALKKKESKTTKKAPTLQLKILEIVSRELDLGKLGAFRPLFLACRHPKKNNENCPNFF
jgi:hypothetical protein